MSDTPHSSSLLGTIDLHDPAASGDSRGRRSVLDQRRENREKAPRPYTPTVQMVPDGGLVAGACRSGGPFDPLGARGCDVGRCDDVVAIVDDHPGRWLLVTLTVNRDLWINPEACYQRVADRVREVARAISLEGLHVTALELQGKTGDGWPHWHLIVRAADGRALEAIRSTVRRAWSVRTEHVDHDTGEVSYTRESVGFSNVKEARDRRGVARYTAKYLLKPWPAVPSWMGESNRQLRKLRLSSGCFDYLERVGRHVRHRGSRRAATRRRRPARRLFDRMARSGLSHAVFRRQGDRLVFVTLVPVPASTDGADLLQAAGGRPVQLGRWAQVRWALDDRALARLRASRDELVDLQRREFRQRRTRIEVGWEMAQYERERAEQV